METTPSALKLYAKGLREAGRHDEARRTWGRVIELEPDNAAAEHNLAAVLGDLGLATLSEAAAVRAISKGGQAAETWLVLGRALQTQMRAPEAERAFRTALERRPDYLQAHRDLAQIIWMQTGDATAALEMLDAAVDGLRACPGLAALRALILLDVRGAVTAYNSLRGWFGLGAAEVERTAAQAALDFNPELSLSHAEAACALAPKDVAAALARTVALLATGRASDALRRVDSILGDKPGNQHALALQRTAWRMLNDPRALVPADYQRLVRSFDIDCPRGWSSLSAFLTDLRRSLLRLHPYRAAPLGQSIRTGAQAAIDPRRAGDRVIDAAFDAFSRPVNEYLAMMGASDASNASEASKRLCMDWEIAGAWSVRLVAGGRHVDHVHPEGWISCTFYVSLPDAGESDQRAGWLRLGAPGLGAHSAMPAEHWIKPETGRLVLFPSHLWHGTQAFHAEGDRLTIAFDLIPGKG